MPSSPSPLPSSGSKPITSTDRIRHGRVAALGVSAVALLVTGVAWSGASPAYAAVATVGLGTAEPFAVLAGSEITNTGPSVINGDVGIAPGTAVTGFPPGLINGDLHQTNAEAIQAQKDLTTAYDDAAGRPARDITGQNFGERRFNPGVYKDTSSIRLNGRVTLNAQGDPDAVFIFQAGSTLITAAASTVKLINGADPCNVFWQVGSSATLGTGTDFVGTIMALTSATLTTGANVEGRVLARDGAVTLDTNVITVPDCAATDGSSDSPTDEPSSPGGAGGGGGDGPGDEGTGDDGTGDEGTGDSTDAAATGDGEPAGPSDSDATGGPAGPGDPAGPIVPVGHPETGLEPSPADRRPLVLYGLAALAALGAVVSFGRAARTPHTH